MLGMFLVVVGIPTALIIYVRTPYVTGQFFPVDQPVEFDHRHHVQDDGIECRYCHFDAERSAVAGIPPTEVCMGCHGQIWNNSPVLEPVRRSHFSDRPIPWNRVHDLPDFVYFDHSIHVNKGVGCVTCHGRVDQMVRVYQVAPLTMGWCLDCHRSPERHLRPKELVAVMNFRQADSRAREALAQRYGVRRLTHCTACHR
ncbi:MAG: cytochrome c3 family protein [Deltaproteobacteria bacterium]|nr:cytochrome c3 family protein [Deltaproteobacteria bacterium]